MDSDSVSDIQQSGPGEVKFIYYVGDFFNILKAFIGTNYQALPFAFHNAGIVTGLIGVFLIATLTDHCCQLMVRCKYYAIDAIIQEEADKGQLSVAELGELRLKLGKTLGYGDIGRTVFGEWCYHLIQAAVWFTQFTTCTCYFIFIGNTIMKMYPQVPALIPIDNTSSPALNQDLNEGEAIPMLFLPNVQKRSMSNNDYLNAKDIHSFQKYAAKKYSNTSQVPENQSTEAYINVEHFVLEDELIFDSLADNITNITSTESPLTTTEQNVSSTTTSPELPTPLPTQIINTVTTAPDLKWIVLFPLPFFIVTSLIRKLRLIAPFSFVATVALGIGAISVLVYICFEFARNHVADNVNYWIRWSSLPIFIGQLISAYEGIGCIIPIESSMEGNRWVFPWFLHTAIYIVFMILTSFGVLGYLTYGDSVNQLVVLNLPSTGILSTFIDVTLILSVLFTYPLQCFPVIEITESYLFGPGRCCKSKEHKDHLEYDEIDSGHTNQHAQDANPINETSDEHRGLLQSNALEASITSMSTVIPRKVSGWQRNLVRFVLTLCIMGLAILCRNAYAYLGAFTGAVGCALLAYIIPCAIHLKVKHNRLSWKNLVKDWGTIVFSIIISITTLIVLVIAIVEGNDI